MHIENFLNNGIRYLRLVESKRMLNKDGKYVPRTKVVLNIGPLSKFDDGKPDYVLRLRESFRRHTPLIDSLKPFVDYAPAEKVSIEFRVGDPACIGDPKRLAPCVLDPVFSALQLDQLFASIKHASKIEYDLQGIVRLLTYGRILEPASKMATMAQNGRYYIPLVKSANDDNVYDALDVIHRHRRQIIQRMNTCISRGAGRNPGTVFYDVTNFFFEVPRPDDDILDDEGNVLERGLRKMGVSKENRRQPIVQLGLFMDDNGIPISFETFPGNTLDHHTLREAMKRSVDSLGLGRFVLVADRGMYSGTNMYHVREGGNGYIVSKSLRKSLRSERNWALNGKGYTSVGTDFKYKSRIVERKVRGEDGREHKVREKVVVYWSRAFYERERNENRSFMDFIERLKANPGSFRISSAQSKGLRRFLKKEYLNKETGETVEASKIVPMIDEAKLTEFNELMGYYQIVSSELDLDARAIIDKYHGLTQIEDQFREMKGTLETRPVFVQTREHIDAHLMVCFMALTMLRIIQRKTKLAMGDSVSAGPDWSYGIPGSRIANALRDWQVDSLPQDYYRICCTKGNDLRDVLKAFGVELKHKIYTRGEIQGLKATVSAF